MNRITFPIGYYPDPTKGKPISGGSIYVGEPDTDPTVPGNQKTVTALQENGSEVSIPQPILTSAGGVPLYNGSPVSLFVLGNYSIKVLNSLGVQEYYIPDSNISTTEAIEYFDTVSDMIASPVVVGNIYATKGYYTSGDGGGATYLIKTAAQFGGTPNEYGDHTVNTDDVAVLQYSDSATFVQFGAKGDGATDDTAAITAAIQSGIKYFYGRDNDVYILDTGTAIGISNGTIDLNGATFKQKSGSQTGNWLSITQTDGFTLKNYKLDGNRTGAASLNIDSSLLVIYNVEDIDLINGEIYSSSAKGIAITSSTTGDGTRHIRVNNLTAYDCKYQCLLTDRSNGGTEDPACEDIILSDIFVKDTDHAGIAINDGSRRVTINNAVLDVNNTTWDALSIRGSREITVSNVIGRRGRHGCQIFINDAAALARGEDTRNITLSNNIWEFNDQSGVQIIGAINVAISSDVARNNAQGGAGIGFNISQVAGVRRSSAITLASVSGIDDQSVATQQYPIQVTASDDVKISSPVMFGNTLDDRVKFATGVTGLSVENDKDDGATRKYIYGTTGVVPASSFATVTLTFTTPFDDVPNWALAEVFFGSTTSYLRVQKIIGLTATVIQVQVKNDHTVDATGTLYSEVRYLN